MMRNTAALTAISEERIVFLTRTLAARIRKLTRHLTQQAQDSKQLN
ncbi:hypothetical protein [Faecalibaculum rodentium]|nr:hypothetical protein [Faecalibaculum rodentium]